MRIASARFSIFQRMARKWLLNYLRQSRIALRWCFFKVAKIGPAKLFGDAPRCWASSSFNTGALVL